VVEKMTDAVKVSPYKTASQAKPIKAGKSVGELDIA
jgi:hypothetical protein